MKYKKTLKYAIISAWILLSFSLIRTEAVRVMEMPENLGLSLEGRKIKVDGPIYTLLDNVRKLTPPDSSVALLLEKDTHFRKAAYYLYPRKIVWLPGPANAGEGVAYDYLALYYNPSTGLEGEAYKTIDPIAAFDKIYGGDGSAIFIVGKNGGR
ncbi:MAG: hypothetical protein HY894_02610 [Deltaproteobacteria bacterium]|nr:hypothetical protein [Deltaproteobacteria bacterium]